MEKMKIIEEYIKLKRDETAIILYPSEYDSKYNVSSTFFCKNKFGEISKIERFGGDNSFDEAIETIRKFNKYPPDYIIIRRQIKMELRNKITTVI